MLGIQPAWADQRSQSWLRMRNETWSSPRKVCICPANPTERLARTFGEPNGACSGRNEVGIASRQQGSQKCGTEIATELERRGVIADLVSSNRVTGWAYSQTELAGGLTWLQADEMVPLPATWRDLIQR